MRQTWIRHAARWRGSRLEIILAEPMPDPLSSRKSGSENGTTMRYRSREHYLKVREAEALLDAQDLDQWPNWPPEVFEKARVLWEDDEKLMRLLERIKE